MNPHQVQSDKSLSRPVLSVWSPFHCPPVSLLYMFLQTWPQRDAQYILLYSRACGSRKYATTAYRQTCRTPHMCTRPLLCVSGCVLSSSLCYALQKRVSYTVIIAEKITLCVEFVYTRNEDISGGNMYRTRPRQSVPNSCCEI